MFDKHVHTCIAPVGVGIFLTVVYTVPSVVHIQLTSVGIVAGRKECVTEIDGQFVLYTELDNIIHNIMERHQTVLR